MILQRRGWIEAVAVCLIHLIVAQAGHSPVEQSGSEHVKSEDLSSILAQQLPPSRSTRVKTHMDAAHNRQSARNHNGQVAQLHPQPLNANAEPYFPLTIPFSDEHIAPYMAKLHATLGDIRRMTLNYNQKPKRGQYLTLEQRRNTQYLGPDDRLEESREVLFKAKAEYMARKAIQAHNDDIHKEAKKKSADSSSVPPEKDKSPSLSPSSIPANPEGDPIGAINLKSLQKQAADKRRKGKGIMEKSEENKDKGVHLPRPSSEKASTINEKNSDGLKHYLPPQYTWRSWQGSGINKKEDEVWRTVSKSKAAKIRSPPKGSFIAPSMMSSTSGTSKHPESSSIQSNEEIDDVNFESAPSRPRSTLKGSKGKKQKNKKKSNNKEDHQDDTENLEELIREMQELDKKRLRSDSEQFANRKPYPRPEEVGEILEDAINQTRQRELLRIKYRGALKRANPQQRKVLEKEELSEKEIEDLAQFQDHIRAISKQFGISEKLAKEAVVNHHKRVANDMESFISSSVSSEDGKFDKDSIYDSKFGFRSLKPEFYELARARNAKMMADIMEQASGMDPKELSITILKKKLTPE